MKSYLILAAFLLYSIRVSESCSCAYHHPQDHFCDSDFVALVRVKSFKDLNEYQRVYKVKIRKEFKMSEKSRVALKSGRLHTASVSSICGASLDPGHLYVISGRVNALKAFISICDLIRPWERVTRRQRKGLRKLYGGGCKCMQECVRLQPYLFWEQEDDICMVRRNGKCGWNKPLTEFQKEEKKRRESRKSTTHLPFLDDQHRKSGR